MSETEPTGQTESDAAPDAAPAEPGGGASALPPPSSTEVEVLPAEATETTGDALFDALWAKVLAAWDDDKAHAAALEYSVTSQRLPDLAGRYRALKAIPAKAERAQKRLDAIVLAATQLMMSMRTPANTSIPLPITLSVAGLFVCAVLFVAYAMLHRQ